MARLLSTSGTGVTQSLSIAEDNSVIRNYATEDAIATAIANDELDLGQVVSCTDTLCLYRIIVDPDDETSTTYEKITGGGEGAPLGSIVGFYSTTAPAGWLACDGSTFDADKYPALAMYLGSNVLPDLRGEFLRGAGANGHANQGNGGNVGEHQDATEVPVNIYDSANNVVDAGVASKTFSYKQDSNVNAQYFGQAIYAYDFGIQSIAGIRTRPTNTSVLWCIKATSSYVSDTENTLFNQIKDYVDQGQSYSTTETLTGGTWIDGKPIYRITLQTTSSIAKATWGLCGLNTQFSNLNIATPVYGISVSSDNICRTINVSKQDGFFCDSSALSPGTYLTIEYTKTTD